MSVYPWESVTPPNTKVPKGTFISESVAFPSVVGCKTAKRYSNGNVLQREGAASCCFVGDRALVPMKSADLCPKATRAPMPPQFATANPNYRHFNINYPCQCNFPNGSCLPDPRHTVSSAVPYPLPSVPRERTCT